MVEIVSKYELHSAARAAWAVRSRSLFMQDMHNDDILAATKSFGSPQNSTQLCPSSQPAPFAWGSSATRCTSFRTQT